MASTYRTHPAFGVARVGDSDQPGFVGPEMPGVPANWNLNTNAFDKFKDVHGRIRRQGVRFRVFEYDGSGEVVGEVAGAYHGLHHRREHPLRAHERPGGSRRP